MWNFIRRLFYNDSSHRQPIPGSFDDFLRRPLTTAEQLSAVHRCATVISSIIASIPIRVVKFSEEKGWTQTLDHPAHWLLNHGSDTFPLGSRSPNVVTAFGWKQAAIIQMLYTGNSCLPVRRNQRFQVSALSVYTSPKSCLPKYRDDRDRTHYYEVTDGVGGYRELPPDDVLHLAYFPTDGFMGQSPIDIGLSSFKLTSAAENRSSSFVSNGRPDGFLTTVGTMTEQQKVETRAAWRRVHSDNPDKEVGILSGGMDWKQYGFSAEAIQLLQTRKFQIEEICRWFGVPPHMLYQIEKSSYSAASQLMVEFFQSTIMPLLASFKSSLRTTLFTTAERERAYYDLSFDLDQLYMIDSSTYLPRMTQRLQNGVMTINDWRDTENRPRVPEGDKPLVMASQFAPLSSMFATTDPNKVTNPTDPTKPADQGNPTNA